VAVAVPLAVTSAASYFGADADRALENRGTVLAQRRALTRLNANCAGMPLNTEDLACRAFLIVRQECLDRQSLRLETGCPDTNDLARIAEVQAALEKGAEVPSLQEGVLPSVTRAAANALRISDLMPSDRLALRHAIQLGSCSKKLPQAMYLLCTEMVGENVRAAPVGLLNDIAKVQADRLARQSSSIRASGVVANPNYRR
jgi:hypothetical protein